MNETLAGFLKEASIDVTEHPSRVAVAATCHEVLPQEEGTDGRILSCSPVESPVTSCAK
jgi:hypothetical protein